MKHSFLLNLASNVQNSKWDERKERWIDKMDQRQKLTGTPFPDSSLRMPLALSLCLRYSGKSFAPGLCSDSPQGTVFWPIPLPTTAKIQASGVMTNSHYNKI